MGCLLVLFIVSFVVQKLLSLSGSHLLTSVFISIVLGDGYMLLFVYIPDNF